MGPTEVEGTGGEALHQRPAKILKPIKVCFSSALIWRTFGVQGGDPTGELAPPTDYLYEPTPKNQKTVVDRHKHSYAICFVDFATNLR